MTALSRLLPDATSRTLAAFAIGLSTGVPATLIWLLKLNGWL